MWSLVREAVVLSIDLPLGSYWLTAPCPQRIRYSVLGALVGVVYSPLSSLLQCVPIVVEFCVHEVETHGLEVEGIYR